MKCVVIDISNAGRKGEKIRNGATLKLQLHFEDPEKPPLSLVIKQVPPSGLGQSMRLGLVREGLFFRDLAPSLEQSGVASIPTVFYAYGDMETGEKVVLMEDLSGNFIDCGILFGPGNPNNWSRNLHDMIDKAYGGGTTLSSFEVARQTFNAIAKAHATFWKDKSLLERRFLKGSGWIQGKERDSWVNSQSYIQSVWKTLLETKKLDSVYEWDPLVRQCLEKAMDSISWDGQMKRLNTNSHWTLVHGDFWPGNFLLSTNSDNQPLKMLDWEIVGIGSGPQDLGQYEVSMYSATWIRQNVVAVRKNSSKATSTS